MGSIAVPGTGDMSASHRYIDNDTSVFSWNRFHIFTLYTFHFLQYYVSLGKWPQCYCSSNNISSQGGDKKLNNIWLCDTRIWLRINNYLNHQGLMTAIMTSYATSLLPACVLLVLYPSSIASCPIINDNKSSDITICPVINDSKLSWMEQLQRIPSTASGILVVGPTEYIPKNAFATWGHLKVGLYYTYIYIYIHA